MAWRRSPTADSPADDQHPDILRRKEIGDITAALANQLAQPCSLAVMPKAAAPSLTSSGSICCWRCCCASCGCGRPAPRRQRALRNALRARKPRSHSPSAPRWRRMGGRARPRARPTLSRGSIAIIRVRTKSPPARAALARPAFRSRPCSGRPPRCNLARIHRQQIWRGRRRRAHRLDRF